MPQIKLTNGARHLAYNLLSVPGTAANPMEVLRVGRLMEVLEAPGIKPPHDCDAIYLNEEQSVEVTDAQKELLKTACTKHAAAISSGKHATRLMEALGFGAE